MFTYIPNFPLFRKYDVVYKRLAGIQHYCLVSWYHYVLMVYVLQCVYVQLLYVFIFIGWPSLSFQIFCLILRYNDNLTIDPAYQAWSLGFGTFLLFPVHVASLSIIPLPPVPDGIAIVIQYGRQISHTWQAEAAAMITSLGTKCSLCHPVFAGSE